MAAPVVLTAEGFGTGLEGAGVWAGVPLHVLSEKVLEGKVRPGDWGYLRHFTGAAEGFVTDAAG